MPRAIHQAVNRVAKQMSDKANSAGSAIACIIETPDDGSDPDEHDASVNYSLGKTYAVMQGGRCASPVERDREQRWERLTVS